LQLNLPKNAYSEAHQLIDSMPIVMAKQGRRFTAKVAPEIATANGYCAAKKMYYYGVKLHVLGCYQKGKLPIPNYIGLTNAGTNDRKAYEQILPELSKNIFADKAYQKENNSLLREGNTVLHTPVKKQKGQEYLDSADKLLSSAISSVRQPIESFFNWLQEKTSIQMASKVRSYNGLMVHVFGRIAAAMFLLVQRFSS
jgi:Transposase DDE domain